MHAKLSPWGGAIGGSPSEVGFVRSPLVIYECPLFNEQKSVESQEESNFHGLGLFRGRVWKLIVMVCERGGGSLGL